MYNTCLRESQRAVATANLFSFHLWSFSFFKGAALNANLREALVAQHRLREEVIGKLQRSLQESKRYILRLEEDAIEADKARGMMEKSNIFFEFWFVYMYRAFLS